MPVQEKRGRRRRDEVSGKSEGETGRGRGAVTCDLSHNPRQPPRHLQAQQASGDALEKPPAATEGGQSRTFTLRGRRGGALAVGCSDSVRGKQMAESKRAAGGRSI